uniref:Gypsy retrotransposon integrase-like protein 1 n=1 Tax=Cajanus cajan TaxID=3821 RepID=A0A151R7J7_CAJCA|nr:Gypsy retrotransposon integrase-like protein 1 [Cajanus cajan]
MPWHSPGIDQANIRARTNLVLGGFGEAISAGLIREHDGQQQPIYFISRVLQDAERRYQLLEKVALALMYAARRLRQYFQSTVVVQTDCPIAKVLRKPELAGRMMACPSGIILEQSLRFGFKTSNNQAEYEALLAGMRLAVEMGATKVVCWTDSKVVAEQVNDNFQVKDAHLLKYYHMFKAMKDQADQLARLASSRKPGQLRSTIHLELPASSIPQECMPIERPTSSWMTNIINYIINSSEPSDPLEAKKVRTQAARYSVIACELYRRGFSTPLLKCLDQPQADYVLREVHEGICGSHSGARTLAAKVLRAGYYWPTLKTDCAEYVKKCKQCQQHGNLIHASAEQLHSVSAPWPFALWGIDILGPFPLAKGQCKFLGMLGTYDQPHHPPIGLCLAMDKHPWGRLCSNLCNQYTFAINLSHKCNLHIQLKVTA